MRVMIGDEPLQVQGAPLRVIFQYDPELPERERRRHKGKAVGCLLTYEVPAGPHPGEELMEVKVLGVGVAYQHPSDLYQKAVGRKVALKHALANAGLPRDQRALVWNWFFSVCRQPEANVRPADVAG